MSMHYFYTIKEGGGIKGGVLFLILILIMIFSINKAYADQVILQPNPSAGNDTEIRRDIPDTNLATADLISVGLLGSGDPRRALLQFNISVIPASSTITYAQFQAFLNSSVGLTDSAVEIHRITEAWTDDDATWNNRLSSTAWTTAGGTYSSTVENLTNVSSTQGWYNWTITSLVQSWVNSTYQNNGLIMIGQESAAGSFKRFSSSDTLAASFRPILTINFTSNVPPTITSIADNSNQTSPTPVNLSVNFTVNWNDIDSQQVSIFVCNSTSVLSNTTGNCLDKTFCIAANTTANPASCQYAAQNNDSSLVQYYVIACDNEGNCSSISQAFNFSVNHIPSPLVISPNGGETVNQSQGNYTIRFNASDADNNTLTADIYYSAIQGAKTNLIVRGINLSAYCTDSDVSLITANNCSYSWNSSGVFGTFYLDISVNDTINATSDSSDSTFRAVSLEDNTAPNVTNDSIDSGLTSGRIAVIRANITEANINTVWFEVNDTNNIKTNYTMQLQSGSALNGIYNGSFEVGIAGAWTFQVFANDTLGNKGNGNVIGFNVSRPNATPQNERYQSSASPSELISIRAELNATDILRGVYAYINDSNYFTFLSGYPKNQTIGNITGGNTTSALWLVMAPSSLGSYNLTVLWSDKYSNSWNSSQINITVARATSSNATSNLTLVKINSYPEVEGGNQYLADILVKDQNGNFVNASSVKIKIFDSVGNLVAGPVDFTSQVDTGIYRYNYTTPSTPQGQWETRANVTRDGAFYFDRQYWNLVGGPFDVRNIQVLDNTVPDLAVSVITENTGGVLQDLTLVWNLTKADTGDLLSSGADTFAVGASSTKTWTVYPSTTFVGDVKIRFIGTWSSTEKAGAFSTFTTTQAGASPGGAGNSVGGGVSGGAGGYGRGVQMPIHANGSKLDFIEARKIVEVTPTVPSIITIGVKNTGNITLNNLRLTLEGLPSSWYNVDPLAINALKVNEVEAYTVNIKVPITDIEELNFSYLVESSELSASEPAVLHIKKVIEKAMIKELKNHYLEELDKLKKRVEDLKYTLSKSAQLNLDLSEISVLVKLADEKTRDVAKRVNNEQFNNVDEDIRNIKLYLSDAESKLRELGILVIEKPPAWIYRYWVWIVTWIFLALLIATLYLLYKRISLLHLFTQKKKDEARKEEGEKAQIRKETKHSEEKNKEDEEFHKRIKKLKDELRF